MGTRVFSVVTRSPDLFKELDQVLKSNRKTILFIDNYPDWMDVLEHFAMNAGSNCSLVLAARSAVHDVLVDRLRDIVGGDSILEYNVDLLNHNDLMWISSYFEQYGLWAEKAAWSTNRKLSYLQFNCRAQLSRILTQLFQSPEIGRRFEEILRRLNDRRDYYEVLLSVLILAAGQHTPTTELMTDIWGELVLQTQFRKNDAIREFFDFQVGVVRLRSSVAARFILSDVADVNLTVDTLTTMAKAFDKAGRFFRHTSPAVAQSDAVFHCPGALTR